jgi:hypothetical protein
MFNFIQTILRQLFWVKMIQFDQVMCLAAPSAGWPADLGMNDAMSIGGKLTMRETPRGAN